MKIESKDYYHFLKNLKIPQHLRTTIYNHCIFSMEHQLGLKAYTNKFPSHLDNIGKVMIGIPLRYERRNERIKLRTKVTDKIKRETGLKWDYGSHVTRLNDRRWTSRILK